MAHDGEGSRWKTYAWVMGALAVLTIIEVYTPNLADRALVVPLLFAMAIAKASFVVAYYMHLRWEPNTLRFIPLAPLALVLILLLALIFGITPTI